MAVVVPVGISKSPKTSNALQYAFIRPRSMRKILLLKKEQKMISKGDDRLKQIKHQQLETYWSLLGDTADLFNAINFLPKGYLWAQSFPLWKVGAFGLISSLVGLRRLY